MAVELAQRVLHAVAHAYGYLDDPAAAVAAAATDLAGLARWLLAFRTSIDSPSWSSANYLPALGEERPQPTVAT